MSSTHIFTNSDANSDAFFHNTCISAMFSHCVTTLLLTLLL